MQSYEDSNRFYLAAEASAEEGFMVSAYLLLSAPVAMAHLYFRFIIEQSAIVAFSLSPAEG